MTNISGASVSCRMQLTTTSCSASTSASGAASAASEGERAARVRRVAVEVPHPHRRRTARRPPTTGRWVSTVTSLTPSADSAPHRAARGGAEADHRGAQAAAVVAGDPEQLKRVQDRAVAGQLVVLVEDVDGRSRPRRSSGSSPPRRSASARRSMASWVISRSCTQCGQPQTTCPGRSVSRSSASGLGSSEHVALREELLARAQPADQRRELRRRRRRSARRSRARGTCRARSSASMRSRCAGWIASRRSSGLRDVATTPRVRSVHGASL